MASNSFAKNVVTTVDVPQAVAPDFTQNTSDTQDLVGLASFGLQLKNRHDAKEINKAAAARKSMLASVVLDVNNFQHEMGDQLNSLQLNNQTNKILQDRGLSPMESLVVKEEIASQSGNFAIKKREAEIDVQKGIDEDNNANAVKYTGQQFYDESNPEMVAQIERGLKGDAVERVRSRDNKVKMEQLALAGATRENNDEVAEIAADDLVSGIATNARTALDSSVAGLKERLNLEKGQEGKISQEEYEESVVLLISQGEAALQSSITELLQGKGPLEKKHILAKWGTLKDNYKVLGDELQNSSVGGRYSKYLVDKLSTQKQGIERSVFASPALAKLATLAELGLIDASAFKTAGGQLALDLLGKGSTEMQGLIRSELQAFPVNSTRDSFLSRLHSKSPEAYALGSATVNNSLGMIASKEAGDPNGASQEMMLADLDKSMDIINSDPQKGHFSPENTKLVTDQVLDRWDTMTPVQQERLAAKLPAYVGNYFGDDSSGAFVPAVTASYKKIVTGGNQESGPLYSLGVDPATKGIKVIIASDSEIMKQVSIKDSAGNLSQFSFQTLESPADRMRTLKLQLNSWARKVENMPTPNKLLNSISKANGAPKEEITKALLQNMAANSSISVHKAFIPAPVETESTEGSLGTGERRKSKASTKSDTPVAETSDLNDEEFAEYQKQQLLQRKKRGQTPQ